MTDKTSFLNPDADLPKGDTGGDGSGDPNPGDNPVVFEYGGRKYTADDLAKKLEHADQHIERLTQERKEDRELLQAAAEQLKLATSAAEVLKAQKDPAAPEPKDDDGKAPAFDPEALKADVVKSLREELLRDQQEAEREKNWAEVTKTLTTRFGRQVDDKVAEVAEENGFTVEEALEFAKSKPKVFLKLFPEPSANPSRKSGDSRYNSSAMTNTPKRPDSAYGNARTSRDQVAAYTQRLAELSGG